MRKLGILIAVLLAIAPAILIGPLGILWIMFLLPMFSDLSKAAWKAATREENQNVEKQENEERKY